MTHAFEIDWNTLPAPVDDGGARHLPGLKLPSVKLASTKGEAVDLSRLSGRSVVYVYPMTGQPEVALPDGWNDIPGARGCTPQSCAFRDHAQELADLGAAALFGLSTQDEAYQLEAATRLHLPFALLSDKDLALTKAISLPTFEVDGKVLTKRLTMILRDGVIEHVFYPVFPPDQDATKVMAWLAANPA